MPVVNERALHLGVRVAIALGSRLARVTRFDRKSYFYPDLPKGYQITQRELPLARGGALSVEGCGSVRVRSVHIEEDAGKTVHEGGAASSASLIDMNRCGVPLVEIVTEPVMGSASEAESFLRELRRLLTFIGATRGLMHEGDMRFDCNVSLGRIGGAGLGTPTEIKNLNSFRSVRRSLEREIERQTAVLEAGGAVDRETMLWDEPSRSLVTMRSKEASRDYRYMTEPDIPAFTLDESIIARVASSVPETPGEAVERLERDHGLSGRRARSLVRSPELVLLFDLTAALGRELAGASPGDAVRVADWVTGVTPGILRRHGRSLPREAAPARRLAQDLSSLLAARHREEVTEASARQVLERALLSGRTVREMLRAGDVSPISSGSALGEIVRSILDDHGVEVERMLSGESRLRAFFMGQIMRRTRGRADPGAALRALDAELASRRKRAG